MNDAYALVQLLHRTLNGSTYMAMDERTMTRVCVKVLKRSVGQHEAYVMQQLGSHPHVLKYMDFLSAENGRWYLVTEFKEGGDLFRRISTKVTVTLFSFLSLQRFHNLV